MKHRYPILVAWIFWTLPVAAHVAAAEVTEADYRGFKTLAMTNGLVSLQVAPEIGGRVIQLTLDGFDFFWVNPQLVGHKPPPSGVGPNGEWLNYGGEKLWPAPQGWDGEDQWPGPPDAILDGAPHRAAVVRARGCPATVELVSQKDPRSGIQFSRAIQLFDHSTRVHVDATMTNIDTKPRCWGIWSNAQNNAAHRSGTGYDPQVRVYCPINPKSIFPKGYEVLFGLAGNTQFRRDDARGLMVVDYQRRVGKIGLDCSAGWLATVNGSAGYVFVQRFPFFPGRKYPDNSSVEIWTNGTGECVIAGKIEKMPEDPRENGYLVESEILSPLAHLEPGEKYTFGYDWFTAAIGGDYPVLDCSEVGVVCEPLAVKPNHGQLVLRGRFGVFYEGTLAAVFCDESGKAVGRVLLPGSVGPTRPVAISTSCDAPSGAAVVRLAVCDAADHELGELARTRIP